MMEWFRLSGLGELIAVSILSCYGFCPSPQECINTITSTRIDASMHTIGAA